MRVALVPINPTVGDIDGNAAIIAAAVDDAARTRADLAVFPELALCGYPPRDLLLHDAFIDACRRTAETLAARFPPHITVILGTPLPAESGGGAKRPPARTGIANALIACRAGRIVATYAKRLLPTYDVFDEDRYFVPGDQPVVIDVPASTGTRRVGLAICEDLWQGQDAGFAARYADAPDPVADLVDAGADLIVSPSASPFVLGKADRHRDILAAQAARHQRPVLSVNQSGANDELVFDGHAVAYAPTGRLHAAAGAFDVRPLMVDLHAPGPTHDPLQSWPDERLLLSALVLGTRDYLRKTGFTSAVLGLSGGIDSAVTAAIAALALGPQRVTGLILPGPYSSEHSKADAIDLAQRLGIHAHTIHITPAVDGFRHVLDPALARVDQPPLGRSLPDLAEENLQSRVRGTALMAWSNRTGAIVLTTGNKSELAVGYCTLYGDMNGGLAVLSDVSKRWVYRLARWMNAHHRDAGFDHPPIPESTITKPPSAELRPGQTDQDSLPPYDQLDDLIEAIVERRLDPDAAARHARVTPDLARRIARMIDLAEYKRKQAAIGLKVTTVAFGSGRRVPIAHRWRP